MIHINDEFPQIVGLRYLNHAAVAPWPRRAASAVSAFAEQNATLGARDYPQWLTVERSLRQRLTRLLNAPTSADVALVKNTSEALSFVAFGLDWKSGDRIVISDEEFPSNRVVWEALQPSEYGFWANVNPAVPHPRWSQATERVIATGERVPTQIFNGYGEFVAQIYSGLEKERLWA